MALTNSVAEIEDINGSLDCESSFLLNQNTCDWINFFSVKYQTALKSSSYWTTFGKIYFFCCFGEFIIVRFCAITWHCNTVERLRDFTCAGVWPMDKFCILWKHSLANMWRTILTYLSLLPIMRNKQSFILCI